MEVGRQVLSRPPASAPLRGRPRLERKSGYGAAEASSASPSRAESTPGLTAGRCRRCGAAWRCHGNGLGLAGRSQAGGLLEGVPQVQRTTEQRRNLVFGLERLGVVVAVGSGVVAS